MRRRKIRGRRFKSQKQLIIFSIIFIMIFLSTGYAAFSTKITLKAKGNIIEKSRIIKSWTNTSNEDFHTDFYRERIVNITFLNNRTVPYNATESWDVSQDGDKGVMAYVVPNTEDNTKYDLYIGANRGVIGNEDSSYIFYSFPNLKNIEFNNNYDTSKIIKYRFMFGGGNSLKEIDLSSFNTSKANNMTGMFTAWNSTIGNWGNKTIKKIILGNNFVTNNVIYMNDMFSGQPIEELDLSNFNTSKLISMYHMFNGCNEIKELNLSSFNTHGVTDIRGAFFNCPKLEKIIVSNDFVTSGIIVGIDDDTLFKYNIKLVGGNGTTYDASHTDIEYARIDTTETPGYFTLKQE